MNNLKRIIQLFECEEYTISDNFFKTEVSSCITKTPKLFEVQEVLKEISNRDRITIELKTDDNETITIINNSNNIINENDYNHFLQNNEYTIYINIEIIKDVNENKISIYDYDSFWNLDRNEFINILKMFSLVIKNKDVLYFVNYDNDCFFTTKTLVMSNSEIVHKLNYDRNESIKKCKNISNFWNNIEFELLPEDFNIESSNISCELLNLFKKIKQFLSIIYLCNYSRIEEDVLYLNVVGYKNNGYTINIKTFEENEKFEIIYNIYLWVIYEGNEIDKIGIVRNVISIHCQYSTILEIDSKTFDSIKSNYNIYLKKNVDQYIEQKNKAIDFIVEISKEIDELIMYLIECFKKNLGVFFTFIITTVLANAISTKPLDNILTDDIVAIITLISIGSIFYIIFILFEIRFKEDNYKKRYIIFKNSYEELFEKEDINNIFKNDEAFDTNIKRLKKYKIVYILIWIFCVALLIIEVNLIKYKSVFIDVLEIIKFILNCIL